MGVPSVLSLGFDKAICFQYFSQSSGKTIVLINSNIQVIIWQHIYLTYSKKIISEV